MNDKERILIIDNDRIISNFIATILTAYDVLRAATGNEAISLIALHAADLILLDPVLPDIDGIEMLRNIRDWSDIPVIILSARQDENEIVKALDTGADDYITKPFGRNELLARIRKTLQHHNKLKNSLTIPSSIFYVNGLKVDYMRRLISINDEPIHLTPIEYRILVLLARNAGKVLTHDYIIREIWGPYSSDRQVLWVNMANIRRKIEENPSDPKYILTEIGIGYRMADDYSMT